MRFTWLGIGAVAIGLATFGSVAVAQDGDRLLEFHVTPTRRAQIAIWIEDGDGTFLDTVVLTSSVALRGVGNRPGALQMNSGFRWPYGRREGILPIWAHRRADAPGADLFPRVIFQDRDSEGFASRTSVDSSPDSYFCLSFDQSTTTREALDAVTCASVFNSDKGRFMREEDVRQGYAEPYAGPSGSEIGRSLSQWTLYPPRRDVDGLGQYDHPDVARFVQEARRVMPNIDAVTMATPPGGVPRTIQYLAPADWEDGPYTAWIEVNVEGDYNEIYNAETYPTPVSDMWDFWAQTYGYPYRGQPSVVYAVPFTIGPLIAEFTTAEALGHGSVHGDSGDVFPMDASIADDPTGAPGSGVDRLLEDERGVRFSVLVLATQVCTGPEPPDICGQDCDTDEECGTGYVCVDDGTCMGLCDVDTRPSPISDFTAENHPNSKWSHVVGRVRFTVPRSSRPLRQYKLITTKILTNGEVSEDAHALEITSAGRPIQGDGLHIPVDSECQSEVASEVLCGPYRAGEDGECENGLDLDGDGDCLDPGDVIEVDVAFDTHETEYVLEISAVDLCQQQSDPVAANLKTTQIDFTTVPPCFVATAAYGSPLAEEIWALRRFRDRYLMTNPAGRAFVDAYYALGPYAADIIAEHPWLRTTTRFFLAPLVSLARHLTAEKTKPKSSPGL